VPRCRLNLNALNARAAPPPPPSAAAAAVATYPRISRARRSSRSWRGIQFGVLPLLRANIFTGLLHGNMISGYLWFTSRQSFFSKKMFCLFTKTNAIHSKDVHSMQRAGF